MRTGAYTFSCRVEDEALLPVFKGSTLRGGIGHALRRIVCALKRRECDDCLLAATCAYSFLFANNGSQSPRRPHPYLLVAPDHPQRYWQAGDEITFSLVLFGQANDFLPHLIYAVKELGAAGLGKKSRASGRFTLSRVTLSGVPIWQNDKLQVPTTIPELRLGPTPTVPVPKLQLHCLTPLRLKFANELQAKLPFHVLIRAALRRVSALEKTFGSGEPAFDYKGMVVRAEGAQVLADDCRWRDIKRYSNRQKVEMLFGGIQGSITYGAENLAEFVPLLRYCEQVNLGKQTTFGLGQIRVDVETGAGM